MDKRPNLLQLFLYFLKIGAITFGGGYAIIATLEKELVEKKKWITHDDMLNMIVVGESTPGPIAINLATFIGYKMHGFWGSFLCTLGFVLPSFLIIVAISVAIQYITEVHEVVKWMFKGVRAGVVVLIGNAAFKFFKRMDKKIMPLIVFLAVFFIEFFTNVSAIYLILAGAVIGLGYTVIVSLVNKKRQQQNLDLATNTTTPSDKNIDTDGKNCKTDTINEQTDSKNAEIDSLACDVEETTTEIDGLVCDIEDIEDAKNVENTNNIEDIKTAEEIGIAKDIKNEETAKKTEKVAEKIEPYIYKEGNTNNIDKTEDKI